MLFLVREVIKHDFHDFHDIHDFHDSYDFIKLIDKTRLCQKSFPIGAKVVFYKLIKHDF